MGNSLVHAFRPNRLAVPPIAMLLPGVSGITKLTMRAAIRCHSTGSSSRWQLVEPVNRPAMVYRRGAPIFQTTALALRSCRCISRSTVSVRKEDLGLSRAKV